MGYLVNVTGEELSTDMSCPSTIEPFKIEEGCDEWFYDEGTLSNEERMTKIIETINKNRPLVKSLIIKNTEFGRMLFEKLYPSESFVISVKRPNSELHWYYQVVDRIKDPAAVAPNK